MKRKGLNPREKKIIMKRVQGKSMRAIADDLKMSEPNVFFTLKRLQPELQRALELSGYGLSKAISKMVEMTEAKKTEFFASNGIVLDSRVVEDNTTRLAARREMLRVHGVGNEMTVEHTGQVEHVLSLKEKQEAAESLKRIEQFAGEAIDVEAEEE